MRTGVLPTSQSSSSSLKSRLANSWMRHTPASATSAAKTWLPSLRAPQLTAAVMRKTRKNSSLEQVEIKPIGNNRSTSSSWRETLTYQPQTLNNIIKSRHCNNNSKRRMLLWRRASKTLGICIFFVRSTRRDWRSSSIVRS